MTLDVGPGRNVQPHEVQPVIRLDHRLIVKPNVVGDVRVLPFRDNVFGVVYASHVLEHFHYRETDSILREWLRVLRPGGEFQLFVPNLEWCLLQLVNGVEDDENIQHSLRTARVSKRRSSNGIHTSGIRETTWTVTSGASRDPDLPQQHLRLEQEAKRCLRRV